MKIHTLAHSYAIIMKIYTLAHRSSTKILLIANLVFILCICFYLHWSNVDWLRRQSTSYARVHTDVSANKSSNNVEEHYILAVAIMSAAENQERRDTIRSTWKNGYQNKTFYTKFVLGTRNLTTELVQSLQRESDLHQDMLLLTDLIDTYQNLSHKLLASLVWFDTHVNYSYIVKCDDDSFTLLDRIEDELLNRNDNRGLYWGYFIGNAVPKKEGQWGEPNWKFCDLYFPYAFGGGYILSADVVHRIALNADGIIVYNNEDVTVGSWTVAFDIERKHDVRFDTESMSRGCKNTFLVTHKQSMEDMVSKHNMYLKTGKICNKEEVKRELQYNWNAPPSQCYQ